jgi:hypothetical protein
MVEWRWWWWLAKHARWEGGILGPLHKTKRWGSVLLNVVRQAIHFDGGIPLEAGYG